MKTFTVEGLNWKENFKVDDSLFDNYEDMAFEAMTVAVEEILSFPKKREAWRSSVWHSSCDGTEMEELPRWGDSHERGDEDDLMFGWTTVAWEKGHGEDPDKRIAALTELVLRNSGEHEWANLMHESWKKQQRAGQ